MNAASGGIAACWSRGTKLSQIGYKVAGPVRKEGAKAVSQMAGKKLIKEVGKQLGKEGSKVVRNLTLQRIGIKIAEGVAFGAAQSGVEYVVHNHLSGLCAAIRSTVTSDMDRLFREHDLSTNLLEAYKIMGERKADQRQFKDQLANSARLRKDLGLLQKAVETKEAERDAKFRRTPGKYTEKHIRRQGGKNLQMPSIPEDKVSDHITEYNANSNIEVTFETDAFNVDSSETSEEHYEHVERVANQSKFERKEHTTIMGNQDKLEDDAKKLSEHMGWNNDKKMHPIKFKRTDGKPVNARRTAIVEITNPDGTKHYQADRTRSERIEGEGVTAFMYGGSLRHDGGMNEERQRMSSQSSAQEPSRELKPPELPREQTKEKQPDKRDE
uniref:Uncharacterized protein n=1 Tax=Plectus sambesii TaxID=2011161 RepID=A0A914W0F9_9BILA